MKLKKELATNSGSRGLSKFASLVLLLPLIFPLQVMANPSVPSASFVHIEDQGLLQQIGLSSAWCYNDEANAILITSQEREQEKCELRLQHELEKQKISYQLQLDNLQVIVNTLIKQHEDIVLVKNEEINRLEEAALTRPNDYSLWWATG